MRIVFSLLLVVFFQGIAFSQPSIQFDSERYDFRKVSGSVRVLEHVFMVTNVGDKDLIIEQLVPS